MIGAKSMRTCFTKVLLVAVLFLALGADAAMADPVTLFTAAAVAITKATGVILTAGQFALGTFITGAAITAGVSLGINAPDCCLRRGSRK
jgi:hypothetical protein